MSNMYFYAVLLTYFLEVSIDALIGIPVYTYLYICVTIAAIQYFLSSFCELNAYRISMM